MKADKRILDALQPCDFTDLAEWNFYEKVIQTFKEKYKSKFTWDTGCTKGVLIFKDFGYVIKIPFCQGEDEDEFCGADSEQEWNYCEAEINKYIFAQEYGVSECFAKSEFIQYINGYPIYIQEYALIFSSGESTASSSHTEEELKATEKKCNEKDYNCFNREWLSDVLTYFGENVFYKLLQFIDIACIDDLHLANIGYIGMRPVLIDYSSFNH